MSPAAPRALCIVAAFSAFPSALDWARQRVREHWGAELLESPVFAFGQTDYYTPTMGAGLRKCFLVPLRLFDPAELATTKLLCRRWEDEFRDPTARDVARPLNLDPGYLTQDKLVLASTKNHAHRIYLKEGIFAELTLQYRRSGWQPLPWTYPDYQSHDYHLFFSRCREELGRRGSVPPDESG
jgi:hypothetical protein